MNSLFSYVVVFCGAGLGGMLRHAVNGLGMRLGTTFPWSTLFVNVTGCLIMGVLAGWFTFRGEGSRQALRLFLTTGVLGGYTTFSAFSLDTALLWQRGQYGLATLYVGASVLAALAGIFVGLSLMRRLL
jgi:fluoride exporter